MVVYTGACVFALTWNQPPDIPPVTSTTVTYCLTASPNCGDIVQTVPVHVPLKD